jgi:hypothetical protein
MDRRLSRAARARYARSVGARPTVLFLAIASVAGAFACTGGPGGGPSVLDLPGDPAGSSYDNPGSSLESAGPARDTPPTTNEQPTPGTGPSSAGGGCPPCGTYQCEVTTTTTSNGNTSTKTSTVAIPFTSQGGGACGYVSQDTAVVLTCSGAVLDGTGKAVGTWQASGSSVTLSSPQGDSIHCTVGGADTTTSPPPVDTTTVSPPQPGTATPVPSVDAG